MSLKGNRIATMQEGGTLPPPQFIAVASAGAKANGTTSVVCPVPTGTLDGHVMDLIVFTFGNAITTPAGWTLRTGPVTFSASIGTPRAAHYTRTASSEPANYTINHGAGADFAMIITHDNILETLDVAGGTGTHANSTVATTPSVTTVTPGCLIIRVAGCCNDEDSSSVLCTFSWAASVERGDAGVDASGTNTSGVSISIATLTQAGAGATGTEVATANIAQDGAQFTIAHAPG